MPVSMTVLAEDQSAVLREILVGLDELARRRATPAAGWTIADQASHLAHLDAAAVQSAVEPDAFRAALEQIEARAAWAAIAWSVTPTPVGACCSRAEDQDG
ncbi:maleylpyruvate isomerase N-terminal domain-containing protein [Pseudonocardia adelaidensis]|uniref:Mycothiol-dependent maleylpyruvate isomerase metal-binding domain-containing protein n=1 Tax=Pseudonocardia adelaidensis TaxID=648754 RepID=A0ABP9NSX4_9PSEU